MTGISTPLWPEGKAAQNRLVARFAQLRRPRPPQSWIDFNRNDVWHMRFTLMWLDWFVTILPKTLEMACRGVHGWIRVECYLPRCTCSDLCKAWHWMYRLHWEDTEFEVRTQDIVTKFMYKKNAFKFTISKFNKWLYCPSFSFRRPHTYFYVVLSSECKVEDSLFEEFEMLKYISSVQFVSRADFEALREFYSFIFHY
jgi:hypothetical protein